MTVVSTWNVENLFRPGGEFGPKDDATYQAKLNSLAATITHIAPDVIGLQEVGEPLALADLVERLDGDWHVELSKHFDGKHPIRVGFLSRHPLEVVADVADFPEKLGPLQADDDKQKKTVQMGRGALAVRLSPTPNAPLTVVSCHLKSKLLSFPSQSGKPRFNPRNEGERARYGAYALFRRAAEAVTVRALTDDLLGGHGQDRALVVLGDLNDEPRAATTQILLGPPGSELGTGGFDQPDKGDGGRLWNLESLIPEKERFSRVFRGRGELIDHILVSHALVRRAAEAHTIDQDKLPSITEDPTARREARGSDHAPVVVRFAS
jgi:endonuclease/exonuclease/phosphatase family metal-dependent hydrolase